MNKAGTGRTPRRVRVHALKRPAFSSHHQDHTKKSKTQRSKRFRYAGLVAVLAFSAVFASKMNAARSVKPQLTSMQPKLATTRAELDVCPLSSDKDKIRAANQLHSDTDVHCLNQAGFAKVLAPQTSNCFTYAKSDYESAKVEDPIDVLGGQVKCRDMDKSLTETHKWKRKIPSKECAEGTTHVRSYLTKPGETRKSGVRQDYHFVVKPDSEKPTHQPGSLGVEVLNKSFVEGDGSLARKDVVVFDGEHAYPLDIPEYGVCDDYCVERDEAPKGRISSRKDWL